MAARKTIETGNVNFAFTLVKEITENELQPFEKMFGASKCTAEVQDLADEWYFKIFERLHRARSRGVYISAYAYGIILR